MTGRGHHYDAARQILQGATLGHHPDGSPRIRDDEPEALAAATAHGLLALADEVHALIEAVKLVPGAMR